MRGGVVPASIAERARKTDMSPKAAAGRLTSHHGVRNRIEVDLAEHANEDEPISFPTGAYRDDEYTPAPAHAQGTPTGSSNAGASASASARHTEHHSGVKFSDEEGENAHVHVVDTTAAGKEFGANRDTMHQAQEIVKGGAGLRPRELLDLSDPDAPAWQLLEADNEADRAKLQAEQSRKLAHRKAVARKAGARYLSWKNVQAKYLNIGALTKIAKHVAGQNSL